MERRARISTRKFAGGAERDSFTRSRCRVPVPGLSSVSFGGGGEKYVRHRFVAPPNRGSSSSAASAALSAACRRRHNPGTVPPAAGVARPVPHLTAARDPPRPADRRPGSTRAVDGRARGVRPGCPGRSSGERSGGRGSPGEPARARLVLAEPIQQVVAGQPGSAQASLHDPDGHLIMHRNDDGTSSAWFHQRQVGTLLPGGRIPVSFKEPDEISTANGREAWNHRGSPAGLPEPSSDPPAVAVPRDRARSHTP